MEVKIILVGHNLASALLAFDTKILNFINDYCHNPVLDKVMPFITFLGNSGLIWILISSALLLNRKYRHVGIMVLGALLVSNLLGEGLLKHLVHRSRPFVVLPVKELLIPKPLSFSFPSGHTASSFAAAGILAKEFRKYGFYFYVLAALIAFSRMYLYVHYPSDILGGILLGLLCSKVVSQLFYEYIKRKTLKK